MTWFWDKVTYSFGDRLEIHLKSGQTYQGDVSNVQPEGSVMLEGCEMLYRHRPRARTVSRVAVSGHRVFALHEISSLKRAHRASR